MGKSSRVTGVKSELTVNLWALATWDSDGDECIHKECYAEGMQALNAELDAGRPVIVGVDYHSGKSNFDNLTDHWVVIVGRGSSNKGQYYTYYEVAEKEEAEATDTSKNRFYFHAKGYLESIEKTTNSSKKFLIVTAIRINPSNCCCSRYTLDDTNTTCKDTCETYNHKTTPQGTLIKFRK
jgi:hypothetical protein